MAREVNRSLRRASFWVGVGMVSVLAQAGVELAADWLPFPGLRRLVAYIHRGPSGGQ